MAKKHEITAIKIEKLKNELEGLRVVYDQEWVTHVVENDLADGHLTPEQVALITGGSIGSVRNFMTKAGVRETVTRKKDRTGIPYRVVKEHMSSRKTGRISEAKRTAIVNLGEVTAMQHREIAEVMDVNVKTVARVLKRRSKTSSNA